MSCFPCFSSERSKNSISRELPVAHAAAPNDPSPPPPGMVNKKPSAEVRNKDDEANTIDDKNIATHMFTFRELAAATKNFRQECLLGEGGFGRVFKGTLQPSGQVVAVKQLDRNGMQGSKEFHVEVLILSLLHHPNLVKLIGYCADGDQRLLVYEYMPSGSVEDHLHGISEDKKPLDWIARMKMALGAAQGLEYLHEKANPPIIYRDLKSSNIMLDEELNPRLSDYGIAKLGLGGSKMHVSPRVMGTYGYCAPEYERTGELTLKSDVYSFGVVLLELITGRRAIDTTRPTQEQNLVSWAQPFFRDPKRFPDMADPILESKFPVKSLNQAVGVAAMCLQEEPAVRPLISDVVAALSFLTVAAPGESSRPVTNQPSHVEVSRAPENHHNREEERDIIRSEEEQDSDSDSNSESDDDGDYDHPHGSKNSDSDDGDSVEDHQEQENSEKNEAQIKKSVKWASRCRSKVDSQDGSVRSSSSHDSDTGPGQSLNSNSSVKWRSYSEESLDGRYDSSHDSNIESRDGSYQHLKSNSMGSNSRCSSNVESQDESVGSSSSSETSDVKSVDGSSSTNSRSNSGAGPKYGGGYGSNSRQDSGVGPQDEYCTAFEVRSNSNVDSQDGSMGSNSWRNSNVESQDGSLRSDSSRNWNSRHHNSVGAEHGNALSEQYPSHSIQNCT